MPITSSSAPLRALVEQYGANSPQVTAIVVAVNSSPYRIGTRINIDVLNAQQQLHAAQRDLFKARTDTLVHSLRLKAAVGDLHPDALQALNQLLMTDEAGAVNNPPTSSPTP